MLDAMLAQAQKETAEAKEKLEAITRDLEDKAVEIAMLKYQVSRKEILYQSAMEIGEQKRLRAEIAEKRLDWLKTAVVMVTWESAIKNAFDIDPNLEPDRIIEIDITKGSKMALTIETFIARVYSLMDVAYKSGLEIAQMSNMRARGIAD